VRHGFLPEREVMTGIGTVPVQVPRVRDRGANEDGSKIKYRSALVSPYLVLSRLQRDNQGENPASIRMRTRVWGRAGRA